ncbi:hypothetical protein O6H91_Y260700 [Diphasiastrum complanatum]|nr:hypothetical protein O6H91_Y260700 [Diphasiastrum complanatum]
MLVCFALSFYLVSPMILFIMLILNFLHSFLLLFYTFYNNCQKLLQFLVQWDHYPIEKATWQCLDVLTQTPLLQQQAHALHANVQDHAQRQFPLDVSIPWQLFMLCHILLRLSRSSYC